ncbi:hypothetical protein N7508_006103 [Penicillium antarcticum]|uniref:uncharacterized protein n=1 Tax=Penicillium antarcticum TaxID=416450 RepID=UPI002387FCDB|nr:uncharacterized protein N7508_006103 [Penicillium antarcticum]KAJ5301240.1 hypothetical protein N7508_006103 [Penicillium antarcticum]
MKVFGLREEHRVSLRLFYAIDQELRDRNLCATRLPAVASLSVCLDAGGISGSALIFDKRTVFAAIRAIHDIQQPFYAGRVPRTAHRWMEEFSSIPPCLDLLEDFLRQLSLYQRRIAVKSVDTIFAWLWEWKDGYYDRKGWKDKPYRMVYQQSFEAISQILGKARAREWKKALKTSFLQSHWLLPYPHNNGFMRKSKDTGQEVWWSSSNAGLYEHYKQWYGTLEPGDLLPAGYIKHHPTTG